MEAHDTGPNVSNEEPSGSSTPFPQAQPTGKRDTQPGWVTCAFALYPCAASPPVSAAEVSHPYLRER